MDKDGWIKLHRQLLDNPICTKDSDYLAVWIYLLLNATHKEHAALFKNKRTTLQPGQLITGRKSIASKLHISESKVQRILTVLESEQQIEQQTTSQNRLITIRNWGRYQGSEQQIEQQVNNEWTTSEQRVNTNKNVKNGKNEKNNNKTKNEIKQVKEVYNETYGCSIKSSKAWEKNFLRWREDYTLEEIIKAIKNMKKHDWIGKLNKRFPLEAFFRTDKDWIQQCLEVQGNTSPFI